MNKSTNDKGVSLVEVLIAMSILLIFAFPLIYFFTDISEAIMNRKHGVRASTYAQSLLEEIKQKKWDQNTVDSKYVTSPSTTLGLDSGETNIPDDCNDIDDYNGYIYQPEKGFTCAVKVKYVNVNLNDTVTDSANPTDFKQIIVEASSTRKGAENIILKQILANGI